MMPNAIANFYQTTCFLTFCITFEIIIFRILPRILLFCLLLLWFHCYNIDRGNILEHLFENFLLFIFYGSKGILLVFPCIINQNVFPGFSTVFLFTSHSSSLILLSLRIIHFIGCIWNFRPVVLLFQSKISHKGFYTNKSQNANPANWDKLKGVGMK